MMLSFAGAASLFLATKLALGDDDKTIFIPLTLSRTVPQPPYTRDDPVVHTYSSFSQDYGLQREVQKKLADATVKAFNKYRDRFGQNMRCSIVWLWFQYPSGPPPKYEQSGLAITRNSIQWTSREIHPFHYYRYMLAVWPEWMFNSLKASFLRVIATIKDEINSSLEEEAEVDSKGNRISPILTIPHPELTGKVAFDETVGNFRNSLRQTPPKNVPVPPKGHVRVTGIVQIMGEKMLINADVDATFDPTTCDKFTFTYIKVRYVVYSTNNKRQVQPVQTIQRQAVVDALRQPPPVVPGKDGEGLLEGAKAVIQEAARKARVQSGERTTGAESAVTAIREAQDAKVVEARDVKEERKEQVTPVGHAPIPAPTTEKKPERAEQHSETPGLSMDEIDRKVVAAQPQHDGSADGYPPASEPSIHEHPHRSQPSNSKPESE